ncbi:sodium:solute symporter family protein [Acetohalobium arabaticum]|uniref:Na+/solute symporter n=1 Tax=Acetohalobium arabaticum (strain ATCC 49924 / DSM 5501 / Z-7288) TaxID=574087 RepID=D9QPN1_ACEAZ|nr:sodium:solute symporter family protein [Acetohalobium arabaticum]ADL12472.1 Na+/solute symporter [Acetohalobium arabaticum DSM 5501]
MIDTSLISGSFSGIPFVMMGIYIVAVVYLSVKAIAAKKIEDVEVTFEEHYTANKTMPGFIVALLILVTFYSGSTFTGKVGFVVKHGVAGGMFYIAACVGAGIALYFLAEKIWPLAKKYRLSTLADLMELRYQSKKIKVMIAAVVIAFSLIWLILEMLTLGYIFSLISGGVISKTVGSFIGMTLIVTYVMFGGVRSVASVDSFSALVMLFGSITSMIFLIIKFYDGNIFYMFNVIHETAPQALTVPLSGEVAWQVYISYIFLTLFTLMLYPANYMEICLGESLREVRKSAIATAFSGLWNIVFILISLAGIGLVGLSGLGFEQFADPQSALLEMAQLTGSSVFFGLVTTFMFAAALGTVDSTLMSLSGVISNDIITAFRRIKNNEKCIGSSKDKDSIDKRVTVNAKKEVRIARISALVLSLLAFALGTQKLPMMLIMVAYAGEGIMQLIPLVLGGLYWKKSTPQGAYAGTIVGLISFLVFKNIGFEPFGGLMSGFPALALNSIVFVVVSKLTADKYYSNYLKKYNHVFEDFFVKGKVLKDLNNDEIDEVGNDTPAKV